MPKKPIDANTMLRTIATLPIVRINRSEYLKATLTPFFDEETINKAIAKSPAYAGISTDQIRKFADDSIKAEATEATGFAFAAGLPVGFGVFAAIPADVTQFYVHTFRVIQKLLYLYGWPDLYGEDSESDSNKINDGTYNEMLLFLGVMSGTNAAVIGVNKLSGKVAEAIIKKLPQKALTKGIIYPAVKKVAVSLGIQMTKVVFANGVAKMAPIVGGVISGGFTYATFRPMAVRLRDHLEKQELADVDYFKYKAAATEEKYDDYIDVDVDMENDID